MEPFSLPVDSGDFLNKSLTKARGRGGGVGGVTKCNIVILRALIAWPKVLWLPHSAQDVTTRFTGHLHPAAALLCCGPALGFGLG